MNLRRRTFALQIALLCIVFAACANKFDRTNIQPGDRVQGPAVSIVVPTNKPWFAVDYGTGSRIRLSQLNFDDLYTITVGINRGPSRGMFVDVTEHLQALLKAKREENIPEGVILHDHKEWAEPSYGELCVAYSSHREDWRGRNSAGPALVDDVGLICPHRYLPNVLVTVDIERRYEVDGPRVDMGALAKKLFTSIEHTGDD
jgi:hypothetical protein